MALPATRDQFKYNCLRRLGAPVVEINVDPDQVEDRIDEALLWYWDYHFDGSDKQYYKYVIQPQNFPGNLCDIVIGNSGIGYSNNDTITVYPSTDYAAKGLTVNVGLTTDSNGSIVSIPVANLYNNSGYSSGMGYTVDPVYRINTSTGSGALLQPLRGGYIQIPDNIIGVVNMYPVGQGLNTNNLFNIRYQIALNDLYTLTSVSMVPYYMAMSHVQFLEQLLVGQQPLRYNRHMDRCYIDMDWRILNVGDFVILEAYQIVDPNMYSKVWGDRWLLRYAAALIKQQWGTNLKKFEGMQLPGGLKFNGQKIYDEANEERLALEKEMMENYSMPVTDMIG